MAFVWGRLKICLSDTMSVLFNNVRTRLVVLGLALLGQQTSASRYISRYLAVYQGLLRFFGSSSRTSRTWRNNQKWIVTYEFGKLLDCEIDTTEFPVVLKYVIIHYKKTSDTMSVLFNNVKTGGSSRTERRRENQEWIVTYELGKPLDCEIGNTELPVVTW